MDCRSTTKTKTSAANTFLTVSVSQKAATLAFSLYSCLVWADLAVVVLSALGRNRGTTDVIVFCGRSLCGVAYRQDKSAKLSTKRVRNEGDRFLGAKTVFAVLVVVLVVL